MPEASNPTTRVMDVLGFLAAHRTDTFTLAEIARHVGLSNGSAHRLLTTMAAAQFLSRNEKHRTYSLGVALVAIGQAAIEKHRGIEIARREIARLALELDAQCSISAVVEDEVLVLAKEGRARSHLGLTRVGERRPLVPPVALCPMAWAGEPAIAAYVEKADPHLSPALRAHLRAALALIRSRGFAIAANGPASRRTREAMVLPGGRMRDADYWAGVFELVGQFEPDEMQVLDLACIGPAGVSSMAAPVFSAAGTVAFQIVLTGMPTDLTAQEIQSHAERLCASAAAITSESHGRAPGGQP
ncbi:IclR family transcriptional regulator [Novosphingobium soli]|uniref:IclR family transcriptional regulator n=1 Tax=Novosphingobium soli TaxID=574956 RepID=A0ABV6CZB2_9SPHN